MLFGQVLLDAQYQTGTNAKLMISQWKTDHVYIFFAAHWYGFVLLCYLCSRRNKQCDRAKQWLIQLYHKQNQCDCILVSMDRDEQAYNYFIHNVPFYSVPFQNKTLRQVLIGKFQIVTIPTLGTCVKVITNFVTSSQIQCAARPVRNNTHGNQMKQHFAMLMLYSLQYNNPKQAFLGMTILPH